MYEIIKFVHLSAGIVWIGGMAFTIWALRPVAIAQLEPVQRLPLLSGVLARFFNIVGLCIFLLLATGGLMLMGVDMKLAPKGWHAMLGLGSLMCLIFGHLYFGPFRKMKAALAAEDLPSAGLQLAKIHPLVLLNFGLGWLALGSVIIWR
ncbi:MAG: hypothetical protein EBQ58_08775 [Betaproteobacteria bacterium]|nr:hypothetical protein [Betaproteobacteria bacterium]